MSLSKMTFFERFEKDILSSKKTITIRDAEEKDYAINSIVQVSTFETKRWFCTLKIKAVLPILFKELSDFHAKQENMTLEELRDIIQEIYPCVSRLYVLSYELVDVLEPRD